jgi:hypothetical protein
VNPEQKPRPEFEQRLLAQLKAVVAERGAAAEAAEAAEGEAAAPSRHRRGPRLALGTAMALAVLAIALILNSGGDNTSKAFALVPQKGGGVTVKIYSLEDAPGLEKALEEAGIKSQVTWLPAGKVCKEPHYTPSIVHLPGGGRFGGMVMGGPGVGEMTFGIGSTRQWRKRTSEQMRRVVHGDVPARKHDESIPNVNLDPEAFRPDQSVVISGTPVPFNGDPEGGGIAKLGVAEGTVEPCEVVPALPSGSGGPFGLSPDGGPAYVPHGDKPLSEAAIAAELHEAAEAARAAGAEVDGPPGRGQALYIRTKDVHLEAWDPNGPPSGSRTKPRYFTDRQLGSESAMPALVPTLKEVWTAPDGSTRERETLTQVHFLTRTDQGLWEEAGSPPPFEYDPAEHDVSEDSSGRLVKEFDSKAFRGRREFTYMARLSQLPTEPEALRLTVENRPDGSSPLDPSPADSPRGGGTVERLLEILREPFASAALRAAAFDALAEIPGIGLARNVTDAAGRRGDAIAWTRERGFGRRFIFDPRTSKLLAQGEMIFGPSSTGENGVPADTVFRETAYLRSGIVDSTHGGLR